MYPGLSDPSGVPQLTVFDPDGDGPARASIVIAGVFQTIDGIPVSNVAAFDGVAWNSLNGGTEHLPSFYGVASWDEDGAGPIPAKLVGFGRFMKPDGSLTSTAGFWDGSAWSDAPFGPPPVASRFIKELDLDGDGPEFPSLVSASRFSDVSALFKLSGDSWTQITPSVGLDGSSAGTILDSVVWDPDGAGPIGPRVVVGGRFEPLLPGGNDYSVAQLIDGAWQPVGAGLHYNAGTARLPGWVRSFAFFDFDGEGAQPTRLVAAGAFRQSGAQQLENIAYWDGQTWLPMPHPTFPSEPGAPPNCYQMYSLALADFDGPGPEPSTLVAAGQANLFCDIFFIYGMLHKWTGSGWASIGSPSHEVRRVVAFDPDGLGPARDQIAIAGNFIEIDQIPNLRFARSEIPPVFADLDGDLAVGLSDIAALIGSWSGAVPPAPAWLDLDSSGDVGLGDLAQVIQNWGASCAD